MQLNGRVYDVAKQFAQIWIPAAGALYFALAQIWHFPKVEEILGTVTAVDTFLGVVLGISSASYKASDARFDGTLALQDHPSGEGSTIRMVGLDTNAVLTKNSVTFKVVDQTTPEPPLDEPVQNMTDPRLLKQPPA